MVTINLRVLSRPQEEHLPDIFSSLGLDYDVFFMESVVEYYDEGHSPKQAVLLVLSGPFIGRNDEGHPPKYEPVKALDHLLRKLGASNV